MIRTVLSDSDNINRVGNMKCWQTGQGGGRWARAGSETRPVFVDVTAASASAIDDYVKTEGAWILSLVKREYNIGTVEECAVKCDLESEFVCR